MAKSFATIEIQSERRLCTVDGEHGYFHVWDLSNNLFKGMTGVVEFSDRIERVVPEKIRFVDNENHTLKEINEYMKGDKNEPSKEC